MNKISLKEFHPDGVTGKGNDEDMFFHSYLTGPQGMRYELLIEKHHTEEDVKKAKSYLRRNFDVLSIELYKEE